MPLKASLSKNGLYLLAVIVLTSGIYGICDYYLQSVAKELMLNWAETEAIAIQEGNLLTSITKTQRFLISSSYIKGVKLIKIEDGKVNPKIEFGAPFDTDLNDFANITDEISQKRIGFLHQRAFYQIPKKEDFVLVFDVRSGFLVFLFAISTSIIVLLVIYLIWALQRLEQREAIKREQLLKLAINDLLTLGSPSEVLEKEVPNLIRWWNVKRNELEESKKIAIEQQSKILLGEIASRSVHDIRGALRNIRQITKLSTGMSEAQKSIVDRSIEKVSQISQNLLNTEKTINEEEQILKSKTNIVSIVTEAIDLKKAQYGSAIGLLLQSSSPVIEAFLDSNMLERSISNLVDNAIEASEVNSIIKITIEQVNETASISIVDSGKGISQEDLRKIGIKGFTNGKENGTGLGVFYAKRFTEDLGGKFQIQSELGSGTRISLTIPMLTDQNEHVISVKQDEHIVILEDQPLIQSAVRLKFQDAGLLSTNYSIFSNSIDMEKWLSSFNGKFRLYSDYFLEDESNKKLETGIEVIRRLNLVSNSILFTSAFDQNEVASAAKNIGVPILSKDQFFKAVFKFL